jgi:anti-sigma factor RsiW
MTEMTHDEIRDGLPDLVHGKVDADRRSAIENHLRSCAECASELRVLQMVNEAPSFAPMIDAVKVANAIPPYGGVPAERPRATTRRFQWALAAAAAVVVAGTLLLRGVSSTVSPAVTPSRVGSVPVTRSPATPSPIAASIPGESTNKVSVRNSSRELQVATALDGISDVGVAQLTRDLDGLDGLPSSDPENLGVGDPTTGGDGEGGS